MNNLLILISFLFIFSIKINAYEYLIANGVSSQFVYMYYYDSNNVLMTRTQVGSYVLGSNRDVFSQLGQIKFGSTSPTYLYIDKNKFDSYLENDIHFLNDLYTSNENSLQALLNYFYNDSYSFSAGKYIVYKDYQLLYDENGLVVESIVNGRWAGLYDGPDQSGYLYDEKGDLKYINGVSVSFFESIFDKLMRKFGINMKSIFTRQIFYPLLILIFSCVVLRTVIRIAFQAFLIRFYDKKIGQLEKRREKIENA